MCCHPGAARRWCGGGNSDMTSRQPTYWHGTISSSRRVVWSCFVSSLKDPLLYLWCNGMAGNLSRGVMLVVQSLCGLPFAISSIYCNRQAPRSCNVLSYFDSIGRRYEAAQWAWPQYPSIINFDASSSIYSAHMPQSSNRFRDAKFSHLVE